MLLSAAVLVTSSILASPPDFTTIPADPFEVEQSLSAARIDAIKAIAIARNAVDGACVGFSTRIEGEQVFYDIEISASGATRTVIVNGSTGQTTAPTTTIPQAIATALALVDGFIKSVTADFSATPPSLTVVVYATGIRHDVLINAETGAIVSDTAKTRFPGTPINDLEIKTEPSGLMIVELEEGTGPTPQSPASKVTVHYTGYLLDGTKFDSSVDRGTPATFPLNGVIRGWTEGVGSMRLGGKRKLIIPYEMAYGERGRPPQIPAKATLVFDIELIEINEINE